MKLQLFLQQTTQMLSAAGVDSARLDTLILLEDVLGRDRSQLLAHPELSLSGRQLTTLNKLVTQRQQHLPLAYIRGHTAFFGRDFLVNKRVLIPRPETESIINRLKNITFGAAPLIADVGCGSGCVGITAALEVAGSKVHFYDVDKDALGIASHNARRHKVRGQYYEGNVLEQWYGNYNVVLANLPYVPDDYPINRAAGFEPKLALFSGRDGLDHYRLFWRQLAAHRPKPSHVIIEALPAQHAALLELAADAGYRLHAAEGYVQQFAAREKL